MNLVLDSFEFGLHTQIYYGVNKINELPTIIRKYNYKKVLICTDKGIVQSGNLKRVESLLSSAGIEFFTFTEVEPDPTIEIVQHVKNLYIENGCDALIGMGGGSSIDTAKGVSIAVVNAGDLTQYEGKDKIPNKGPEIITIPTTAGTGSEVTHATVLKDNKRHYKMGILSQHLHAKAAILDPQLLTTVPRGVAAITGMDALSHAIESYTSNQTQPITEAFGLYAIRLIGRHLRPFVARRADLNAASHMMLASTIAGAAFIWGRIAAVHAISHPLGGRLGVAHGLANSLLLPVVMRYNVSTNYEKFRDIAVALGENVEGLSLREAAERSITAVEQLIHDLEIPTTLTALGLHPSDDELDVIAKEAFESGMTSANPKDCTTADLRRMIEKIR
ncbi:iron-containing alcohol dehydrogenase [Paenibacillus naphthalenovorans]|uniref:iron-containing alcohol dehydrogenase n=1 Tax=Paenibacillus naphthalenovorans TaxID=162209 RepID=UPI00088D02AC|nr:iron-containing alcohol dehydrogenase [Paenibacillus naphthalenovorans]SDI44573.1 alcohol dehydrogenase [Paenibacillus naphthalenovorans]